MSGSNLVRGLAGAALLLAGSAHAEEGSGPLVERFNVSLGGFFVEQDVSLRLDGEGQATGSQIDWEREFGMSDKDSFRLDAFWRFAPRHKVRLMWFENNRSAASTLTRDITFGDTTFTVDAEVDVSLDQRIIELAYEYAFVQRDNFELAGTFGVHNLSFEAGISGEVTSPGGGGTVDATESGEADGPLPVVGLRLFWHMGANFYLDGVAQFFAVDYEDFSGSLTDLKLGVTWYPFEHFGVGLGYNDFTSRLDVDGERFEGELRLEYGGPMAWVTAGF